MIDKLNFFTPIFSVGKLPMLAVEKGTIDLRTGQERGAGFLWSNALRSIRGKEAKYNERGLHISIVPGKHRNPPLLRISMNPGILINDHNFFPVTFPELTKSLDIVRRGLIKVGITANIDDCRLARIDIFKNIELDYDFNYYQPALKLMRPKYMSQARVTIDDGYFRIGNGSVQYCCYNKLNEFIKKHHINPATIGVTSPIVGRFELRYTVGSVIKRRFGFETVGALMQNNSFSHVTDVYENELKKNFFRVAKIANQVVPIDIEEDLLRRIKEKYPRIAMELFFTYKRLTGDNPFTIDDWASMMLSAGVSDTTIKDRKKQMMDVIKIGLELKQEPLQVSELLHEIYTKLVK